MSNTFIYSKGEIVEKASMEKPSKGLNDAYKELFMYKSWHEQWENYDKCLASLRRFPYPYPCEEGKELIEGKDFEVRLQQTNVDKYYENGATHLAVPITPTLAPSEITRLSDAWDAAEKKANAWLDTDTDEKTPNKQQHFLTHFNHKL